MGGFKKGIWIARDEDDHNFDLADSEYIHIVRDSEWEKIISFVKSNEA